MSIERARALLVEVEAEPSNPLATLGAAAFAATAALTMAGVMVMGPFMGLDHSRPVSEAISGL